MKATVEQAYKIAHDFADKLWDELTEEQRRLVVWRNHHNTDKGVCHSHDFVDANMMWLDALNSNGFDYNSEADNASIWNEGMIFFALRVMREDLAEVFIQQIKDDVREFVMDNEHKGLNCWTYPELWEMWVGTFGPDCLSAEGEIG